MKHDTDEIRIFEQLIVDQKEYETGMIPGVLPTLDIVPFGEHWLAVMPRYVCGAGTLLMESDFSWKLGTKFRSAMV